jgi:hypothetical protein
MTKLVDHTTLPPSWVELSTGSLTLEQWHSLPPHLTKLSTYLRKDVGLPDKMPSALSHLTINTHLSTLEKFDFQNRLPQSLTFLDWQGDYLCSKDLRGLPRKLQTFIYYAGKCIPYTVMPHLPETLTMLDATIVFPSCTTPSLHKFPFNLRSLSMSLSRCGSFTDLHQHLPHSLTSLRIEFESQLLPHCESFLAHLPAGLKNLTLKLSFYPRLLPIIFDVPLLLTSLNIAGMNISCINFILLPRTLNVLYCNSMDFHDEPLVMVIKPSLPPSLIELNIGLCYVTREMTKCIPRHVKRLNFRNSPIGKDRFCDLLPPELTYFSMNALHVTAEDAKALPRTIVNLLVRVVPFENLMLLPHIHSLQLDLIVGRAASCGFGGFPKCWRSIVAFVQKHQACESELCQKYSN